MVNTQVIGVVTYIEITSRHVAVSHSDNLRDSLDTQSVSLQLVRIAIYLNLSLRDTNNRDSTYTIHTCKWGSHLIVKDLVESRHTLLCRNTQHKYRDHIRRELEDNWVAHSIGQSGQHIQFIAHIVGKHVNIVTILELQRND